MLHPKHNLVGRIVDDDPDPDLQAKLDAFVENLPPEARVWRRDGPEWARVVYDLGFILGPRTQWTIRPRMGRPPVDKATKAASVERSREAARAAMKAKRETLVAKHFYLDPRAARALDDLMMDHPGLNQSQVIDLLIMDAAEARWRKS